MGFIIKNTSGLINTRLTDTGRLKLSQGNFNISYFQVGDSEVSYNTLPDTYNQFSTNILEPNFNSQNSVGEPQSNKQNVKYPYYVDGTAGNTYGLPYMASAPSPIYNRAAMRGFFTGDTTATTITWSALTNSNYAINSNYVIEMSGLTGGTTIKVIYSGCNSNSVRLPSKGDLITIFYDGLGGSNCSCDGITPPTPTPTPTPTPSQSYDACRLPDPTPTPSASMSVTPTPACYTGTTLQPCVMSMSSCYPMMTYKIVDICLDVITLDRTTPDFGHLSGTCFYARTIVYPPSMTSLYDSYTPSAHWNESVLNFESICNVDEFDVKVWNMNIPWSENPAGFVAGDMEFPTFGSASYIGTKEYLGYMSNSGQTDTSSTYYVNSFGEVVTVEPKDQKSIAIIHYTNNTIDLFYGEKFALEPYDSENPQDTTGEARNFKLHLPWLMWHKNPECCMGETFWVDPAGFEDLENPLFDVHHIESTKNPDMNTPGIRYYHLWDTNPNSVTGYPNRVGKVFPDQKIVIIDDEEIIAAMSYKSNRNWTLPAPKVSLVTPNTCNVDISQSTTGILTGNTEYLYVTYRLTNTTTFTDSLHCNYYMKMQGPNVDCTGLPSQNVGVRFGGEFNCLSQIPELSSTIQSGFMADKFEIICQKMTTDGRPEAAEWKVIDFTDQLSATTVNGFITMEGLTGSTFVITQDSYDDAEEYILHDYIDIPQTTTGNTLNFGDEYYFYGSLETDIQATIYEMRYKVNLGQSEFQATSNPTWSKGKKSYITEIGLYDENFDLMIVSKLQSPVLRQGIQQFLVKFDF